MMFRLVWGGLIASTLLAGVVAWRRPRTRPTFLALLLLLALAVAREAMVGPLHSTDVRPYTGGLAWILRINIVCFAVWPGVIAALFWRMTGSPRPWLPVALCGVWALLLGAIYPALRGPSLVAAQGLTRVFATAAIVQGLLRLRGPEGLTRSVGHFLEEHPEALPAFVMAAELVAQLAGPWLIGSEATQVWDLARLLSILSFLILLPALWWTGRKVSPHPW